LPFVKFTRLEIPDVIVVEPKVFPDHRGFFKEVWKRTPFLANGIPYDFVQANVSLSKKYVVRGLHYQLKPSEMGKLVMVLKGKIWDVAVDIRKGSPYYGRWVAEELSEDNHKILWVPPGFAHGFQALEDDTIVLYLVTKEYDPERDACMRWNDPELGIEWPHPDKAILSEKDKNCPSFKDAPNNFEYPI